MKHHPDKPGGSESVFKEINNQYKGTNSTRFKPNESQNKRWSAFYKGDWDFGGFGRSPFGGANANDSSFWEYKWEADQAEANARRRREAQENFSWRFQEDPEVKKRDAEREKQRQDAAREALRQQEQEEREWDAVKETLEECPFCGFKEKITIEKENYGEGYFVDCGMCYATGPLIDLEEIKYFGKSVVATKWNVLGGRKV